MDWIERLWHIDPDHGSGALEVAILLAVALIAWLAVRGARRTIRSRSRFRR
jgi:hypothetical protein